MIDEATAQRFWAKVNKESEWVFNGTPCWEWTGNQTKDQGTWSGRPGYGMFAGMSAHGYLWTIILGREIPKGYDIHHRCEYKPCCNPEHMQVLLHSEHISIHSSERPTRVYTDEERMKQAEERWLAIGRFKPSLLEALLPSALRGFNQWRLAGYLSP